jgi:hypothetical protein
MRGIVCRPNLDGDLSGVTRCALPGSLVPDNTSAPGLDIKDYSPTTAIRTYPTLFPIVESAYHARGGKSLHLPGKAASAPNGRVDLRVAVDRQREIYFLTKSDGAIRAVTGVTGGGASSPSR